MNRFRRHGAQVPVQTVCAGFALLFLTQCSSVKSFEERIGDQWRRMAEWEDERQARSWRRMTEMDD